MIHVKNLQHKHEHANPYIMNNTPNTQQTTPSDYNIEKESIVNATNELIKWYHGCTSHFTAKAKEIIESSDNPDIIQNVFADFLNDEAVGICRELGFQPFGIEEPINNTPQNHDADYDLDDEDDEENTEYEEMLDAAHNAIVQLRDEAEAAHHKAELYKAALEGNIEAQARMLVQYRALATENEELKNRLNQLLYGNQESGK